MYMEPKVISIDRPVGALPMNESKFLLLDQLAMATAAQLAVPYE